MEIPILSDSMAALGPEFDLIPLPRGEVSAVACGVGQYGGFLVSFLVHLCLLGILYFSGYGTEPRPVVYEVSLTGLPYVFSEQGGGEARGAYEATGATRAGAGPVATDGAPIEASAPAEPMPPIVKPHVQKVTPSKARKTAAAKTTRATSHQPRPSSFPVASSSQEAGQSGEQGEQNVSQLAQSGQGGQGGLGGQGTVFSMHQVDSMPAVLRRATPVYPSEAKKQRIEGRVVVRLVVDAGGKATQCIVQTAEPQGYFEASALEAVGRMRFAPGKKAGQAVSTLVLLPFDFRLR